MRCVWYPRQIHRPSTLDTYSLARWPSYYKCSAKGESMYSMHNWLFNCALRFLSSNNASSAITWDDPSWGSHRSNHSFSREALRTSFSTLYCVLQLVTSQLGIFLGWFTPRAHSHIVHPWFRWYYRPSKAVNAFLRIDLSLHNVRSVHGVPITPHLLVYLKIGLFSSNCIYWKVLDSCIERVLSDLHLNKGADDSY